MLKTSKPNRFKSVAMVAALASVALLPLSAYAAGLGRITVLSALGQPLKAELEVTASRDELNSLSAKLAPVEAFRVAGIEYASSLSTLRFSRQIKERGSKHYIEITTDRPVNEPFIDMLVELSWASGRLVREYTFLLDPPELVQQAPSVPVAAPESAPAVSAYAQTPAAAPLELRSAPVIQTLPARASAPVEARPKDSAASKKAAPSPRAAAPAPAPVAEKPPVTMRETRAGDTLGKIANEVRPEGVSLDQMLVALFRTNPDAFNGNMNRMSTGKILNVPDADAVRAIDAVEAKQEVIAQAADFNAYRRKLADVAATGAAVAGTGGRSSAGKISAKVEDKVPPLASGKDKLEVSRTEGVSSSQKDAKGAGKAPLEGRLSALEEDLASRERALREASSRIAQLEKNLSDLKKLAEMKSQAGTALQKQAEATKPAATPAVPPAVPVEPAKVAEMAKAPEATTTATATAPATTAAPAVPAPAPAAPPPKKVMIPEPEPEPDFLEENGPLVFGGAGIIALLLSYLGLSAYRRKKNAAAAEDSLSEPTLSPNSVFSETAAESIDASRMTASELSVSDTVPDTAGGAVDPLVEADTYLAFGRDTQAEEILLEALKSEPTRHAVHLKLLEIYSTRRSTLQFNMLAQELKEQTGGQGEAWERALELGMALDPTNALYQMADAADAAEIAPAEASMDAATEDTVIVKPEPMDPEATMILTAPVTLEAPPAAAPDAPPAEEVASFDFDLDLGEPVTDTTNATSDADTPAESVEGAVAEDGNVLDFDLDLGGSDSAAADAGSTDAAPATEAGADNALALDIDFDLDTAASTSASAPEAESTAAVSGADEPAALDIDIDLGAPAAAEPGLELPEVSVAEIETPAVGNEIEFALDLELPSAGGSEASAEPASAVTDVSALELPPTDDASAMSFDVDLGAETETTSALELPSAEVAEPAAPTLDLGAISLELDTPADGPKASLEAALETPMEAAVDSASSAEALAELSLDLPTEAEVPADMAAAPMEEPAVEESPQDNPEAATKLELAIAYEEMGDRDGARELLEEVLKEGSPAQVAAAQAKLDSLG